MSFVNVPGNPLLADVSRGIKNEIEPFENESK